MHVGRQKELAAIRAVRPYLLRRAWHEDVYLHQNDVVAIPLRMKMQLVAGELWEHDEATQFWIFWLREHDAVAPVERQR